MKMNKKYLIITIFSVLVLSAIVLLSRSDLNKGATGGGPSVANMDMAIPTESNKLSVAESDYDFGSVSIAGGFVTHDFVLTNESAEAVQIREVSTSCMCTEAFLRVGDKEFGPFGMPGHGLVNKRANVTVLPGDKVVVKAQFDPAAHGPAGIGIVKRDVYVVVGENEQVALSFTATVTP